MRYFEDRFLSAAREWLKTHPDKYYQSKVDSGRLLSDNEKITAEYIAENFPIGQVAEPGCGFGQMTAYMGYLGVYAIGFESSRSRYAAACHIKSAIKLSPYERYELVDGVFRRSDGGERTLAVGNVVNGWWDAWDLPEPDKYRQFFGDCDVVFDARLWWKVRDKDERKALLEYITGLGYDATNVSGSVWHLKKCSDTE